MSDVDHEAISDHGDSTFSDNFERDLGVLCPVVDMTIDDGGRPHAGVVVPATAGIDYNGRFAVLAEESEDEAESELLFQRRRVVPSVPSTEQDPVRPTGVDMESGSRASKTDTESFLSSASRSEALPKVEVCSESQFVFVRAPAVRPSSRTQSGFIALDTVNVRKVIAVRTCLTKVPPAFLRGAHKSVMRLALQEIVSGMEIQNQLRISKGWKLFILLPRILLFRPARGGKVPRNQLLDRLPKFANEQGSV